MVKKILLVSANPTDTSQLRLDQEVREIQAGLERARNLDEYKFWQLWGADLVRYDGQVVIPHCQLYGNYSQEHLRG